MNIKPTGQNFNASAGRAKVKNKGLSVNTNDVFQKSVTSSDPLTDGLKDLILNKNSVKVQLNERKRAVGEKMVKALGLPTDNKYTYSEIARTSDGRTAAIRRYPGQTGVDASKEYSVVFFSDSLKEEKEVFFRAYCIKNSPDGSFVAYGGTNKMKVFSSNGEEKRHIEFENSRGPYGDDLRFYPDGRMYIKNVNSISQIGADGKLIKGNRSPDEWKYNRILDELGNVYDINMKDENPHYFKTAPDGTSQRVDLPKIGEPGLASGSTEIKRDMISLTDGSLLVGLKSKSDSMYHPQPQPLYLVKPGSKNPVNLLPVGYMKMTGIVQGGDGSIYGIALKRGSDKNGMPGQAQLLTAYDSDGNLKWSRPLPLMMPAMESQGLFMNGNGDVLSMTSDLRDRGDQEAGEPFRRSRLQAFDSEGNELWFKDFAEKVTVDKVESYADGSVTIMPYDKSQDIMTISGEKITFDKVKSDVVSKASDVKDSEEKPSIEVDDKSDTVNIGGVKTAD